MTTPIPLVVSQQYMYPPEKFDLAHAVFLTCCKCHWFSMSILNSIIEVAMQIWVKLSRLVRLYKKKSPHHPAILNPVSIQHVQFLDIRVICIADRSGAKPKLAFKSTIMRRYLRRYQFPVLELLVYGTVSFERNHLCDLLISIDPGKTGHVLAVSNRSYQASVRASTAIVPLIMPILEKTLLILNAVIVRKSYCNLSWNNVLTSRELAISTSIPLPFSPPTSLPSTSNGSNSTSTTSETSGRSTDGPLTPPIPPTSSSKETSSLTSLPPSATSPTPRPSPTPIQTATTATTSIISTTAASSTSNIVGPSFTLTPPVTVTSTSSGSIESLPSTTTSGGSKSHGNKILTTVLILFVLALCGNENVV